MCVPVPSKPEAEWTHKGLQQCVVLTQMGHRCGYTRIPPGHPWHGKDYDDIDVDVHGGLTFAELETFPGRCLGLPAHAPGQRVGEYPQLLPSHLGAR